MATNKRDGYPGEGKGMRIFHSLGTPPSGRQGFPWGRGESFSLDDVRVRLGQEFTNGSIARFQRVEKSGGGSDENSLKTLEVIHFLAVSYLSSPEERFEALSMTALEDSVYMKEKVIDLGKGNAMNPYGVYYFANKDTCWKYGMYPLSHKQIRGLPLPIYDDGSALKPLF